jgi:hypothetical protein
MHVKSKGGFCQNFYCFCISFYLFVFYFKFYTCPLCTILMLQTRKICNRLRSEQNVRYLHANHFSANDSFGSCLIRISKCPISLPQLIAPLMGTQSSERTHTCRACVGLSTKLLTIRRIRSGFERRSSVRYRR